MRKTRNALLGILTMMSGAILAVPTEAAERYAPGVYKAGPERWFSYPYGASYLKRGKPPLRRPLLRELLRPPVLLRLPLSLLLVMRRLQQQAAGRSRSLARLAQNEELECVSREARSRRRLGEGALEMSVAPNSPPTMIDASRQATRLMVQQRGSKILRRIAGAEDTNDARSVRGNDADER